MNNKAQSVRVRFAPSPTGNLHIGGLRTALFNQLFARHNNGTFVLRIEDTDEVRSEERYTQMLLEALAWCGIQSDEPLVYQSQRKHIYKKIVDSLISQKKMYRCVCTQEDINARKNAVDQNAEYVPYDRYCKDKSIQEDDNRPCVVRFSYPDNVSEVVVNDLVLGTVTFSKDQFDDFILIRSDKTPTYNFAVVVDDHAMRITHVIRGQEHLGNTPKQILLYQACGYDIPQFAHIPLILSPNGGKLSKRDGAVDVLAYKREGYLPDALVNYMVRLGWAHKDQELFTRDELEQLFTLEGVGKKGGVFDTQKLDWVNASYIKNLSSELILRWLQSDVSPDLRSHCNSWTQDQLLALITLYKERVKTGKELSDILVKLHDGPSSYDSIKEEPWFSESLKPMLQSLMIHLQSVEFLKSELTVHVKQFLANHSLTMPSVAQPIRYALTGSINAPGVYDLLEIIGKETSCDRISKLILFL